MLLVQSLREKRTNIPVESFAICTDDVSLLETPNHKFCEYLHDSVVTKLYLDFDRVCPERPSDDDLATIKRECLAKTAEISSIMGDRPFAVASRHGPKGGSYKVSFRVFFRGFRVVYHDIPVLLRHAQQSHFWDMSPYKASEQLLACIYGMKGGGDDRVLRPEPEYANRPTEDFVAQVVDDEWPFYDLKLLESRSEASVDRDPVTASASGKDVIMKLVTMLSPARATNRDDWVKVGLLLKRLGGDDPDAYFEDFRRFSQRATDPAKVSSDHELERTWASFHQDVPNRLEEGSLHAWAKQDSPDEYRRFNMLPSLAFVAQGIASDEQKEELVRALNTHIPDMNVTNDVEFRSDNGIVSFDHGGKKCEINVDTCAVTVDGEYTGMVCGNNVPVNVHLTRVHKELSGKYKNYIFQRNSEKEATLSSVQGDINMQIHGVFQENAVANFKKGEDGKNYAIVRDKDMKLLQDDIIKKSIREHLQAQYPNAVNIFNNCTIIVNQTQDDGYGIDMERIVSIIQDKCRDELKRLVFNPHLKTNNNCGCFYCDPDTNTWAKVTYPDLEELLTNIVPKECFDMKTRRFMMRKSGRNETLYLVSCKRIDKSYPKCFNTNINVFAMKNMLFDTETMTLRPIRMEDNIFEEYTAGWDYDPELAIKHKDDVLDFVTKILPVEEDRHLCLAFFSSMLSGKRAKKLMLLTDKRSGENGKSMLVRLVREVFGSLVSDNHEFILESTHQRDRNSHSAGLHAMIRKRLLLCEELAKKHTIDMSFVKDLTSGPGKICEGRIFESAEMFKFPWEAGIVMTFNQGCMPHIGSIEEDPMAFWKRVIVIPMRSRFEDEVNEESEPYTYIKDKDIQLNFENWRSAFLDLLIEHWDPNLVNREKVGNTDWRVELSTENNPMSEWLSDNIQVTGNKKDYLLRDDVVERYMRESQDNTFPLSKIKEFTENYLKIVSLKFTKKGDKIENRVSKNNVARGVSYIR